jgi:two-component system phosphate regulon sensor histidine kinase PhoR
MARRLPALILLVAAAGALVMLAGLVVPRYPRLLLVAGLATILTLALAATWGLRRLSRSTERAAEDTERLHATLAARLREMEGERSVLGSVVSGMREGLLVVGADRRIRLANRTLCEVLEVDFDPHGRRLEEVVRHPTVLADVEAALAEGAERGESTIHLPATGRSFQLQVTALSGADGTREAVLVLLFDVTRLERLEAVRREFVANVSHELRTPLTSLSVSVETLLDGALEDTDNARRFLGIIRKHAERMGELIEDLTDLSLIETGSISLEPRPIDVAEAVRGVMERLRPLADQREVALALDTPPHFVVLADRRRLEQILTNLLDNAIKYNRPGGRVTIRGGPTPRGAVLQVEDTGIGIPSDSLEKVFHRFHQVDKDRSRRLGGTGLGLAIVKHLMRLHGGRVRVESELGRGSTFTLEFAPADSERR